MTTPTWRPQYGPQQLRDLLGLTEWQHLRAMQTGAIPRPGPSGKWPRDVVQDLHAQRTAIRRHTGSVPDVGADRAAEVLSSRLGITVEMHVVHELAHQGLLLIVGEYKGHPLYCGRTLETWTDRDAIEHAGVAGERLIADRAADRLGVRRSDFDHLVKLGWITPVAWGRGPYTARKYGPDVPLYRAGDITDLLGNSEIDWDAARSVAKGARSPLAALPDRN